MYANPQADPAKWLVAVMLDLLKQDTSKSKADLASAIKTVVNYLEPGLIDQAFGPWITHYNDLLARSENSQSNAVQLCLPLDLLEQQDELKTAGE